MIVTKVLGLTTFFTKSKKAKLAILGIEIAVLGYAMYQQRKEKKTKRLNK